MMTDKLYRETVRAAIGEAQMNSPSDDQISLLFAHVIKRLIEFQGIRDSYRAKKIAGRSIRVESYYFKDREGITFHDDGFVGFAGWADDTNVQPLLRAALDWVEDAA
ncbi:hypothetical protein LCGC14_2364080 [marine sediment metagenome]|uniref:Uncharacterized protein n=1 Tax=marine sediment metagenome TaxID=412755 RepID=A0A0F9C5M3_9ZZZZ